MPSLPSAFLSTPGTLPNLNHKISPKRCRQQPKCNLHSPRSTRRQLLQIATAISPTLLVSTSQTRSATLLWNNKNVSRPSSTVFSVIPTSISSVNLVPYDTTTVLEVISQQNAIFLGEHHNSLVDHALQARIIESLATNQNRPVAVGLECVQQRFQPELDAYIDGKISELDLYLNVEWETRWVWPYELYLPVLRICRAKKIPLVALSMNYETLSKLKEEGGVANLSSAELRAHVGDPRVFADMISEDGFKAYINECITPSYVSHVRMGLLKEANNFGNFYSTRVLRDEAMATTIVRYVTQSPSTLLVCLIGGDHVKFEYGVKGRVQRQLAAVATRERLEALAKSDKEIPSTEALNQTSKEPKLMTAMLNPVPADAFDTKDGSLKLEMAVDDSPIPIADYLWFSSPSDAKPRRRVKERMFPPVERLTSL